MVNTHIQKKGYFKLLGNNSKILNALIEKKIQKFVKSKKRREMNKESRHFQKMQFLDGVSKKSVSIVRVSVENEDILF